MGTFPELLAEEAARLFTRHRQGLLVLFALPLLYTLLFGGLFSPSAVKDVPIGVLDEDGSAESRRLIRSLEDADGVSVAMTGQDPMAMEAARVRGDLAAVVMVPKDYAESLQTEGAVRLEAVINNANTVLGGTSMQGIQSAAGTLSAEYAAQHRASRGTPLENAAAFAAPVGLSLRSLYNTTGGYTDFFTTLLILHALQIAVVFTIGPMTAIERQQEPARLTARPAALLAAKVLLLSATATLSLLLSLAVALALLPMTCRAPMPLMTAFLFCFSFALVSFALCAGVWIRTPTATISYTLFYIMPSILFGGAVWPRVSMDPVSRAVSWLVPIGYASVDFRELLNRGEAPGLLPDAAMLLLFGSVFLTLAHYGLSRQKRGETHDTPAYP